MQVRIIHANARVPVPRGELAAGIVVELVEVRRRRNVPSAGPRLEIIPQNAELLTKLQLNDTVQAE